MISCQNIKILGITKNKMRMKKKKKKGINVTESSKTCINTLERFDPQKTN